MSAEGLLGRAHVRLEDHKLLTGRGQYVDDLMLPGMLHAAIVRSPVAHGVITAIQLDVAAAMPGVIAIYTGRDIRERCGGTVPRIPIRLAPIPELDPYRQHVAATDRVRYVGEPIAIVVAASAAEAEDAADLVYVEIDPLPVVADWRASEAMVAKLFDTPTNRAMTYDARKGDAASAAGDYVRRETFRVQRHSAVTMETRGLLAEWNNGHLTVYGAAKVPFFTRNNLARMMGLERKQVDMIEVNVGGGFGVRGEFYPEDFLVPFAAKELGRPVKWIEDRRENLLAANHSREMECELEIVCSKEGRVIALRGTVAVDAGAYMRTSAPAPSRNVAQFMAGPYDIEHVHIQALACLTNKAPIGTYRGPGRYEADFFRERMFDIAARDLGIDPIAFRRLNLVKKEQIPYSLPYVTGPDRFEVLDSGDYLITLEHCLKEIKWEEKQALQGQLIDGKYHGLAVGCFIEGGAAGGKETARFDIAQDGVIDLYVGSANVGQGLVTILTQIAADALQLPMSKIRLHHGSTTHLDEGFGSFHSRSTVMGGSAVLVVAKELQTRIREAIAERVGCAVDAVMIGPGLTASVAEHIFDLSALAKMGLSVTGEFPSHDHTYSYGAAATHLTVDPSNGRIEILDYFTVEDVGRIINPLTATGQLVGAAVQGLGGALLEQLSYDGEGQFLTGTLADYLMPTAVDFPVVRADVREDSPSPHNPLGAKGIGEGGTVPAAGVVANAVSAALASIGVEVRDLPLAPPSVWELIQAAKTGTHDCGLSNETNK